MKKLLLLLFLLSYTSLAQSVVSTTVPVSTNMVLLGKGTNFFNVNSNLFATTARNYVDLPNMTALRALPITYLANGASVSLLGYYQPGDGGGGTYVLTNSIVGTNAYGGRILASGGTRSWDLLGPPNAEQFGAKGDGTGNDADALNAAIAFTAERRVELIAAKTYRITKSVLQPSNSAINGRKTGIIRGAFDQFVANRGFLQNWPLGNPGGSPQAPNVIASTTNISLAGLTVENENSSLYRPFCLYILWGASNVVIRDCVFGGSKEKGTTNNWLTYLWADDVTVSDSKFINGDGIFTDAFHVEGGSGYNISNCEMAAGDDAIALLNVYDHPIRRVNIVNCLLTSYQGHCIRIGKWNAVTTSSQTNWIEDISIANCQGQSGLRNGGLFIEDFVTSGTNYTKLIRNVSISDVHISMNPNYETYGITNGYNFRVYGASNVTFKNVTITGGIIPSDMWYTRSITIDGLKVSNSLFQGVYAKGIQDLSLRGLDLSNVHSSSLLYIESCGNVFVQDSKFNTASGTGISHIGTNTFLSVVGSVVNAGGSGITLTQNPETLVVTGSTFPGAAVSYAGSVYPAVTMVWGNTGIADVMQRPLAIRQNSDSIINGTITQNTPNFTPLYIANRLDLGSNMKFSFSGGFPSWETTNSWFQWLGVAGMYGRNTSTDLTEKTWVGVGVQHYDNTRGVVQGVRARSGSLRNYLELGYGDTNTQVMTDVSIGVAATNATRVATEILRARTTGVSINLSGVASDPVRPLEIVSSSQGWLPPRLTTAQGDAIPSIVTGEQWYDTTVNKPRWYNGTRSYYGTPSLYGSTTQDPGSVAANSTLDLTDVTGITGSKVGDMVFVADPGFSSTLLFKAWVPVDDTVRIRLVNAGTVAVDLPSSLFRFIVVPP